MATRTLILGVGPTFGMFPTTVSTFARCPRIKHENAVWLILLVVLYLSQKLSRVCIGMNKFRL
ncbi:hypothetical protein LINGRAHAP2_LOCUS28578 [Linum grandiflorum]